MSEREWTNVAISACLEKAFAGEWGAEPAPANAVVLRATDIDNDGHVVGVGAPRAIPKGKLSAKQMIDGDILLEGSGGSPDNPVGRVALFETADHVQPTICSNFFKTLRPNRQLINERFLWRKLCWFYRQPALLSMQQQTTGIINLKFQDYLAAEITLPADKAEQAKIAEVLDTLDTTIRQTEAIIEKLKQVKQGLLHDLLTRGIDANGELRPPHSEAPHLYKASPLGWIPVEWLAKPLGEIADLQVGFAFKSEWFQDTGGVRLLRGDNVGYGKPDWSSAKFLDPDTSKRFEDYALNDGDIVVGMDRTFTKSGSKFSAIGAPDLPCLLVQRVGRFVAKACTLRFLRVLTLWPDFHTELMAQQKGMDIPHLSKTEILEPCVPVPSLDEQDEISNRIAAIEARIGAELQSVEKARLLKSGLMDDLLTGRVRVTPLLNQPATT